MRVIEEARGDVRILRLSGEFDMLDMPEVAAKLAATAGSTTILDLRNVKFATATLLGCLLRARADMRRQGGDLVLAAPSRFVRRVLSTLGVDRVLGPRRGDDATVVTRNVPRLAC